MTSDTTCVRCSRPMAEQAYACSSCALSLAETLLKAAGHAEDAEAVIARQARYGGGGRGGQDEPLPVDLTKAGQLHAVALAVDGWVTDMLAGRNLPAWRRQAGPACQTGVRCPHSSCAAIRVHIPPSTLAREFSWLSGHVGRLRRHPAAEEAFRELDDACRQLARLVDRPVDKELVGMCDCGKTLYAAHGRSVVTCSEATCKLTWNVAQSRDILRRSLDGKLVTAAEAARLGTYLDTDRSREQIRKLINAWSSRHQVPARGEIDGEPTFRFGDICERLARTPRRATALA